MPALKQAAQRAASLQAAPEAEEPSETKEAAAAGHDAPEAEGAQVWGSLEAELEAGGWADEPPTSAEECECLESRLD